MLVLSRKEAQRIRVGDSIVVSIVKIAGDKVRVGIEAPSDVLVLRDELEAWDEASPKATQAKSTEIVADNLPLETTEIATATVASTTNLKQSA